MADTKESAMHLQRTTLFYQYCDELCILDDWEEFNIITGLIPSKNNNEVK